MTARDLIEFFMRYDIDLELTADGWSPDGSGLDKPEYKVFTVRAEKTRIVLSINPDEPWEP